MEGNGRLTQLATVRTVESYGIGTPISKDDLLGEEGHIEMGDT